MEDKVLIGSKAVEARVGFILGRTARDEDYLTLTPLKDVDCIDGRGILDQYAFSSSVATLDEVYTLKVSHSPWVIAGLPSWYKHLYDVEVLRNTGARLVPTLHKVAYSEWERRHGRKLVNLNKRKEDFFNGAVKRFYDHDSVHEAVALGGRPAFYKILEAGSEVKTSQRLFEALSEEEKSFLVFEEVMVLALERDVIPMVEAGRSVEKGELFEAYSKHLRLLITQYSKGWFPQWIIENYTRVARPPLNYLALFQASDKKIRL